jgi:fibronectin type 3 domain-containing protein
MRVSRLILAGAAFALLACGSNPPPVTPPPAVPTGLTAIGGVGQVVLTWNAVPGATSYEVGRSATAGGARTLLATVTGPGYTDTTAGEGATWFYLVRAKNAGGTSADAAAPAALTAPAAPAISVSGSGSTMTVTWAAVQGAASYEVARAPGGTTSFAVLSAAAASPYADAGVPGNTAFRYKVTAKNATGAAESNIADATSAPAAPTVGTPTARNHRVDLTWTASAGATSYEIRRGTSAAGPFTAVGTSAASSFSDTSATNGTAWFYVVRALNATSASADSAASSSATPFREICVANNSSYTVTVYDGDVAGNQAPKRQFGWQTGLAGVAGIAVAPGPAKAYLASFGTSSVNTYDLAVNGNTSPSATLTTSSPPTALAAEGAELFVGMKGKVDVYTIDGTTGALTLARSRALPNILAEARAIAVDATHSEVMVLSAQNQIDVYNRASPMARVRVLSPGLTSNDIFIGLAYDATGDGVFSILHAGGAVSIPEYLRAPPSGCDTATPPVCTVTPMRTPLIGPRVSSAQGIAADLTKIFLTGTAASGRGAISVFVRTDSGAAGPLNALQTLDSTTTPLFRPGAIAIDAGNSRFWVSYGSAGAQVFAKGTPTTFSSCAGAPPVCDMTAVQSLQGLFSGIIEPVALARDLVNGELVVLNQGPLNSMTVYPLSANGISVSPSRVVSGATTGLAGNLASVDVDEQHGEYWVSNNSFASLSAFPRTASGDQAPARSISGASTTLQGPRTALYDVALQQIVVGDTVNLFGWDRTLTGDQAPARTAATAASSISSLSIDPIHDEIFVFDSTSAGVYPRAFGAGPLTPIRSFGKGGVGAVDPLNDEVWMLEIGASGQLNAYSRTGNGTAAIRSISGPGTGLHGSSALAVCN